MWTWTVVWLSVLALQHTGNLPRVYPAFCPVTAGTGYNIFFVCVQNSVGCNSGLWPTDTLLDTQSWSTCRAVLVASCHWKKGGCPMFPQLTALTFSCVSPHSLWSSFIAWFSHHTCVAALVRWGGIMAINSALRFAQNIYFSLLIKI